MSLNISRRRQEMLEFLDTVAHEGGALRRKPSMNIKLVNAGMDSFGLVSMVLSIEMRYDIRIAEEEMAEWITFGDVVVTTLKKIDDRRKR